jgi:hypothetical protein
MLVGLELRMICIIVRSSLHFIRTDLINELKSASLFFVCSLRVVVAPRRVNRFLDLPGTLPQKRAAPSLAYPFAKFALKILDLRRALWRNIT